MSILPIKNLAMIACIGRNGELGQNGQLIWQIPEDMKFFRQTTTGHPVVMGGKTFRSIGRLLPKRENIILSRSGSNIPGAKVFSDQSALDDYLRQIDDWKFIIGGSSLYQYYIDQADTLYLTEVDTTCAADVYFPQFNHSAYRAECIQTGEFQGIPYRITKYIKRG